MPTQIDAPTLEYAAFGGTDWYLTAKATAAGKPALIVPKGVLTRPGDAIIGKRKDLSKGDRVVFRVAHSDLLGTGSVARATLVLTPVHVCTYDRTPLTEETLITVKRGDDQSIDLATLGSAAALAMPLSGAYATVTAANTWLAGQQGYAGETNVQPIDPWYLDITALYNDALGTAGKHCIVVLDFTGASSKTCVELFGAELHAFRPRIEVDAWGASPTAIALADQATNLPTLSVTLPSGATLTSLHWGYDETCDQDAARWITTAGSVKSFTFPMLETSSRVFAAITVAYPGGHTSVYERTWKTRRYPKPKLALPSVSQYDWQAVRVPSTANPWMTGEAWVVLAKSSGSDVGFGAGVPPAGTWRLWRCTEYPSSVAGHPAYRFWPWLGVSSDQLVDHCDPLGAASSFNTFPDLSADDAGGLFHDVSGGAFYFLSSHYNAATGKYDIRLNVAQNIKPTENQNWFASGWASGLDYSQSAPLYAAAAPPSLARTAVITRGYDWRTAGEQLDAYAPLLVAFVADGKVWVFSKAAWSVGGRSPVGALIADDSVPWTQEVSVTLANVVELTVLHALTTDRAERILLAARTTTGNAWLASRSPDVITWDQGFVRTVGPWTTATVTTFSYVYIAQTSLTLLNGELPDAESVYLAVVRPSGVTMHRVTDLLTPAWGLQIAPTGYQSGFLPRTLLLRRWPSAYTAATQAAHNGAVSYAVSGQALRAQRVTELCAVSDEATIAVGVPGTEIWAPAQKGWEGVPFPVIVGAPGAYQVVTVAVGMDPAHLDTPTPDQQWRATTGTVRTDQFASDAPDMRWPGLKQVPGHNTFAMNWHWDEIPLAGPYGGLVMNHAGQFYGKLTGVLGQSLRLLVLQSAVQGAFVTGAFRGGGSSMGPTGYDGSTGEAVGGMEWPFTNLSTWFYTYDAPGGVAVRTWHRLWDTDYVPDGEAGGGLYVLKTPVFTEDTVWIGHDMVYDVPSWQADVTRWRARAADAGDPAYKLVHCVNASGELLVSDAGAVASQAYVDVNGRKLTTWVPGPSGYTNGDGDNYLGVMIEDPAVNRGDKRLIVVQAQEDCGEFTGGQILNAMIEVLLSGTPLAHTLLHYFSFLFVPFENQAGVRDGWSRYQWDTRREGGAIVHHAYGELWDLPSPGDLFPWQGESWIGSELTLAVLQAWYDAHPTPSASMFGHVKMHCDVPNRSANLTEFSAPFGNMSWDIALFRSRFDPAVFPEYFAPTGGLDSGAYESVNTALNALMAAAGGNTFYIEHPWRAVSHKQGHWFDGDDMTNFALAFLTGLVAVSPALLIDLAGNGIPSAGTLGTPAVRLSWKVLPAGVSSEGALGTPAVRVTVHPAGVVSEEILGIPLVRAALRPEGLASAETVGTATVRLSGTILPIGVPSAGAVGAPVLRVTLHPAGVASAGAVGMPSLAAPGGSVLPFGVPSADSIGTPHLRYTVAPVPPTRIVAGLAIVWAAGGAITAQVASGSAPTDQSVVASVRGRVVRAGGSPAERVAVPEDTSQ